MISSQSNSVVHDRVFVVADAKVLHNQSAHLPISKSCDDRVGGVNGYDDDHLILKLICSRSCQSWQCPV